MLAEELPNGRLLEANSLLELRLHPERLTAEIADFLDEVWAGPPAGAAKRPAARANRARPAKRAAKGAAKDRPAKRAGAATS
jgi:hypothetical protein